MVNKVKIYTKEFARNYSLFQIVANNEFNKRSTSEFSAVPDIGQALYLHTGGSLVDIYYLPGEVKRIFNEFGRLASNVSYFYGVIAKFFDVTEEIMPYFEKKKSVKNIDELKGIYELYKDYCYGESAAWVAPLVESLSKEIRDRALSAREKTQHLTSMRDQMFDYNLVTLFPKLGALTHFVTPESVFSGKPLEELFKEANANKNGFIYFDGIVYAGEQDKILKKLNIELDDNTPAKGTKFIKGQSASVGKVRGRVKIILTGKEIDKISLGDILVSPMTRPDFIPAMIKAAAFVTDEGGVTCHAAIVAREMKKPCVIGTRIATRILKDGDLVEVDANTGVVEILDEK